MAEYLDCIPNTIGNLALNSGAGVAKSGSELLAAYRALRLSGTHMCAFCDK